MHEEQVHVVEPEGGERFLEPEGDARVVGCPMSEVRERKRETERERGGAKGGKAKRGQDGVGWNGMCFKMYQTLVTTKTSERFTMPSLMAFARPWPTSVSLP